MPERRLRHSAQRLRLFVSVEHFREHAAPLETLLCRYRIYDHIIYLRVRYTFASGQPSEECRMCSNLNGICRRHPTRKGRGYSWSLSSDI